MVKIEIIVVDRTRSSFLKQGESFYLKRLRRYARAEIGVVKPAGIRKGRPTKEILAIEGDAIAKRLHPRDYVIGLDRLGKMWDSEGLAARIETLSTTQDRLVFITGGPLGLSKDLLDGVHEIVSLSRLTLTHEMSRLLLLEQLYRAFTIIKKESYHK